MKLLKLCITVRITVEFFYLLRHAAVDGEVEGVGCADEDVDDEDNVLGDVVIH